MTDDLTNIPDLGGSEERRGEEPGREHQGSRMVPVHREESPFPMARRDSWSGSGRGGAFEMLQRLTDEMDRIFGGFGPGWLDRRYGGELRERLARALEPGVWLPQIEVFQREDRIVVRADLPGMKKEDVTLRIEEGELVIEGERREELREEQGEYFHSERSYGRFHRAIPLPRGAELEKAEASFRDGVLEVTIPAPRQQPERGRRIDIQ